MALRHRIRAAHLDTKRQRTDTLTRLTALSVSCHPPVQYFLHWQESRFLGTLLFDEVFTCLLACLKFCVKKRTKFARVSRIAPTHSLPVTNFSVVRRLYGHTPIRLTAMDETAVVELASALPCVKGLS